MGEIVEENNYCILENAYHAVQEYSREEIKNFMKIQTKARLKTINNEAL